MINRTIIGLFFIISLLVGCASQEFLFKEANDLNTIEAYQEYLDEYPKGKFSDEAEKRIEELTFISAKKKGTIPILQKFLEKYPKSKYKQDALLIIEEISFNEANKKNSIESYENYLKNYPDGVFSDKARYSIAEIDFRTVKKTNSIEGYKGFIQKYPDNIFTKETVDSLAAIEFENVKKINTVEAYERFIQKYPNSEKAKQAEKNIKERKKWELVRRNPTIETYFHFLDKFPNSNMILSNKMLKEIIDKARSMGRYIKKSKNQLKFNVDSDDNLADVSCGVMILEKGIRLYTSSPVSHIKHSKDSTYFILFYSNNDNPLIVDVYHNKFELNLSYFSGKGYVLINVGGKKKIWDLN